MLGTRKPSEPIDKARKSPKGTPWGRAVGTGKKAGRESKRNYGRLARSNEHSPSVAISGRESGHFVQVRRRTKDSRVQAGQPLALQEITAGSVDGREVERDGTAGQEEAEGGCEGSGASLVKRRGLESAPHTKVGTCLDSERSRLLV